MFKRAIIVAVVMAIIILMIGCTHQENYTVFERVIGGSTYFYRCGNREEYTYPYISIGKPTDKNIEVVINNIKYEGKHVGSFRDDDTSLIIDEYMLDNAKAESGIAIARVERESGKVCYASFDIQESDGSVKTEEQLKQIAFDFLSKHTDMSRYDFKRIIVLGKTCSVMYGVEDSKYGHRPEGCSVTMDKTGKIVAFICNSYNTDWMMSEDIVIDVAGCRKAVDDVIKKIHKNIEYDVKMEDATCLAVDPDGNLMLVFTATIRCYNEGQDSKTDEQDRPYAEGICTYYVRID